MRPQKSAYDDDFRLLDIPESARQISLMPELLLWFVRDPCYKTGQPQMHMQTATIDPFQ